jgi:arylsulfatase A-like enzyme
MHGWVARLERQKTSKLLAGLKRQAGFLILIAIWFGLATGLIEVGILALEKQYLYPMMRLSRNFIWMAPVAEAMFLLLPTLFIIAMSRLWRRMDPLPLVVFVCALLSSANLLLLVPRLHDFAMLLLAGGVAVQIVRYIMARAVSFQTLVRRTVAWMVGLVIALGLIVYGQQKLTERQALAQLPPAAPGAPNILFITLDAVRAPNLSLYGYARSTTPRLEQLAKTGVVFERALSTAPWTLPSHASMFTGRWPHELSTDYAAPLDTAYPTLAEFLKTRGYVTAGFVANYGYCGYETGLNRGFIHYDDFPVSLGEMVSSSTLTRTIANNFRLRRFIQNDEHINRKSAADINDAVLTWLSRQSHKPFFIFLNYFDAHDPYLPPAPFDRKFGPGRKHGKYSPLHHWLYDKAVAHQNMSQETIQEEINAYDGAIAYLDDKLGLLLDELQKRHLMTNTLIIVTSDHGEEFGEHGLFDHGYSLYRPSVHVPLFISFPGSLPEGKRVRMAVSLRDLSATLMDLLGFGRDSPFPGRTLARYWDATANLVASHQEPLLSEVKYAAGNPPWFPISKGDMRSLVFQDTRYIMNGDGAEELYDFEKDPWERQNLVSSEEQRPMLQQFQSLLSKLRVR